MVIVATFYKFSSIADTAKLKATVLSLLSAHDLLGTVIIANEGINGTIAGTREALDLFHSFLLGDNRFVGMEYKESHAPLCPFKTPKSEDKARNLHLRISRR